MKRRGTKKTTSKYTPLEARTKPQAAIPPVRTLQNIYSSCVVVDSAPSGVRYEFEPGQRQPVGGVDVDHLLSLEHGQAGSGCCGGGAGSANYFVEV